jgi:hypothetical protein
MGMYDTVVINGLKLKHPKEVALFLKNNNAKFPDNFQTKDLICCLSTYNIDKNGQIFETVYEPTGKKIKYESPFKDWIDNRSFIERVILCRRRISDKNTLVDERVPVNRKTKLTSAFEIYTYEQVAGRFLSLSYNVIAENGKVKSIKLKEWSIENEKEAAKRRESDNEFKKKMEVEFAARKALQSKWYYPILKETINPSIFIARHLTQKFCNKLTNWSYRWHGV